ncbi:unnamed protein product [Owenia fusiformis]|uniref:Uncharacterized protein n=1 Tax=Owenia fusiformis TaxID=6347 RepID=A0A8J1UJZ6_OWEFU|nr:unnamed protein product [Owenia fusiformis]
MHSSIVAMPTSYVDLHEAAFSGDIRTLEKLIGANGMCPNKPDHAGRTSLHHACMNGWLECVKYLIDNGASVIATDVSGCTPLHCAASNGYVETVKCLINKGNASVSVRSKKGHTPRYMAKSRYQTKVVAFFNEIENKMGGTPWLQN